MKVSYMLAAACLLCAATAEATSVAFFDDDTLFQRADVVMVADVWRHAEHVDGGESTHYELEAIECFKGCQAGQFIMMGSPGVSPTRTIAGVHEVVAGAPHPETGERLIVHLKRNHKGELRLIGLGQSMFKLHYNHDIKRYIASRQTGGVTLVKQQPTPGRAAAAEVIEPLDSFASDVIERLRKRAAKAQR